MQEGTIPWYQTASIFPVAAGCPFEATQWQFFQVHSVPYTLYRKTWPGFWCHKNWKQTASFMGRTKEEKEVNSKSQGLMSLFIKVIIGFNSWCQNRGALRSKVPCHFTWITPFQCYDWLFGIANKKRMPSFLAARPPWVGGHVIIGDRHPLKQAQQSSLLLFSWAFIIFSVKRRKHYTTIGLMIAGAKECHTAYFIYFLFLRII